MSSNHPDVPDLLNSTPSPIHLQPVPSDTVSRSGHTQALQQGQDIFNLPEEPIGEETVDAFHDDHGESPEALADSGIGGGKKPWYKKPSPWWMLTLMPLSAMTLAGVSPSLLQIYMELVCKTIHKPVSDVLAFQDFYASQTRNAIHLPNFSSVSLGEGPDYPFQLFAQAEAQVRLQDGEDPVEERSCASDPIVQAAVSKLLTALLTTQGVLSCITAASWASLSDRLGRRPVLTIASSAVIICYSIFVAVYYLAEHLPGGYWALLLGSAIHGILGGTAAATAATNAYIADCTPATARAQIFSLTLGLRFTGMAIGPTLCALLVRATGTPVAALALVIGTHAAYVLTMLLVVPESLSTEKRAENRRAWSETREAVTTQSVEERAGGVCPRATHLLLSLGKGAFAFLRPLSVAGPITVTGTSGRIHKDWSLTFIAISAGLASIILASYTSMFQFGAATFGWSAVELGYWYSGIVAARALTLTLILPAVIKLYHYYASPVPPSITAHTNSEPSDATPLLTEDRDASLAPQTEPTVQAQVQARKTPAFDLAIAQGSLALEVVCYALVPVLFSRGQVPYVVLTVLASCGAGFGPAIQALAVDLYAGRGGTETGRLFGVLGVVQATSSQILGPTVYGLTYMKIVAVYPQGIFFVSVAAVASALTFLLFVELPGKKRSSSSRDGGDNA